MPATPSATPSPSPTPAKAWPTATPGATFAHPITVTNSGARVAHGVTIGADPLPITGHDWIVDAANTTASNCSVDNTAHTPPSGTHFPYTTLFRSVHITSLTDT